jgi:hypothetical protein
MKKLANVIVDEAFELSVDTNYDSPFVKKARISGIDNKMGGKSDDITVIAAKIKIQKTDL